MRRILLGFLIILIADATYGQKALKTFYTKEGNETNNKSEAYFSREIIKDDKSLNWDVVERYTSNNNIKLIGISTTNKYPLYKGEKQEYYENGNLKSKVTHYLYNLLIDTATFYYENGKEKATFLFPYKDISPNEIIVTDTLILSYLDSLGNSKLIGGKGIIKIDLFDEIEEGECIANRKSGDWKGTFHQGRYTYVENYENGKFISGTTKDTENKEYHYNHIFKRPEYPGGILALRQHVAQKYHFPQKAIKKNARGVVIISFVVEKNGEMVEYAIQQDLGYETGEEGIKALKSAKLWNPATTRGVPVRVAYSIPIRLD